ncbi:hypothetical protein K4H28_07215 [Deefgea tanakiae]|jgi:ABC-type transport system involved in cytochrome c biogenesis ATPase subunit|uniref:Uncharacterized protein n=1 Tax=Deefgea tanakiae TaxID=2865840 RepID=A0ABX8Z9B9_9NEIS|nr:hypothetical protein [Deefgea tanakiae]QZA79177.1 hypothetical protein K4H28_07215 [Deefgea tanakiae]
MNSFDLFDIDVLRVPGRYWLTIAEKEEADAIIDLLAKAANQIQAGSLGVLETKPVLINNLRAWENLILPRWYHQAGGLSHQEDQLAAVLEGLDLEKVLLMLGKLPGQLDLGQRRVVALLRAVMQHASTWVVEEEWLDWWRDAHGRNQMLAKIYQQIELPASLLILSTNAAAAGYQSINLRVDVA